MTTHNEDKNSILFADEHGSVCDAETFDFIAHLRVIGLIPKPSCIMKVNLYHMNIKNVFLSMDLNMDVNLDAPTDINNT